MASCCVFFSNAELFRGVNFVLNLAYESKGECLRCKLEGELEIHTI